jgi:hypothetical protein
MLRIWQRTYCPVVQARKQVLLLVGPTAMQAAVTVVISCHPRSHTPWILKMLLFTTALAVLLAPSPSRRGAGMGQPRKKGSPLLYYQHLMLRMGLGLKEAVREASVVRSLM